MCTSRRVRSTRYAAALLAAAIVAAMVAGCAGPAPRPAQPAPVQVPPTTGAERPAAPAPGPGGAQGNVPFYDVEGRRYAVLGDSAGYVERGVASWYGRDFHGRKTSSGEQYDMNAFTAAHKTLPLPTRARVTNLTNGRSIIVRINDRGPFRKDRLIDLSYGAARELDMVGPGTALVEVEALPDPGNGSGPSLVGGGNGARGPPSHIFVQVGAYTDSHNADAMKRMLESRGIRNVVIRYDARGEAPLFRVRVGPVADASEYDTVVQRVTALDVRQPQLVLESADPAHRLE